MGRRSGGGGGFGGGGFSRAPSAPLRSRRAASPPAPKKTATASAPPPSQGPGLMGQMAATAGGVAIGSALGHAVGNMFGGGRGGQEEVAQSGEGYDNKQYEQQQKALSQPCEFEWRQLVECTQNQSDLGVCQSFNDIFKQCKARYGPQQQQ